MPEDKRYTLFPRWLEESGLPADLEERCGTGAWSVFRRLVEADVQANTWPDWFSVPLDDLARWTGLTQERVGQLIEALVESGYLKKRMLHVQANDFRLAIMEPLPVSQPPESISRRLRERGFDDQHSLWRYHEPRPPQDAFTRVQAWYHETFGLGMNPRLAQDLADLSEQYPLHDLEEAFQAAREAGAKSLRWVIEHLAERQQRRP